MQSVTAESLKELKLNPKEEEDISSSEMNKMKKSSAHRRVLGRDCIGRDCSSMDRGCGSSVESINSCDDKNANCENVMEPEYSDIGYLRDDDEGGKWP